MYGPDSRTCETGDVFLIADRVRYVGQSEGALALISLDIDIFRNPDCVAHLDAKLAIGTFDLRMAQVPCSAVDQNRFRAPQSVCAELRRVVPDAGNLFMNKSRLLPR